MKNISKLLILFVLCTAQLSCSSDDDLNTDEIYSNVIIGEWLRSDYTDEPLHEFKLIFLADNEGGSSYLTTSDEGVIGAAGSFEWSINNNILIINQLENQTVTTAFEFTSTGNLLLPEYSNLEFIRQ